MFKSNPPCFTCGTITYPAQNGQAICPLCGFGSSEYIPPFTNTVSEKTYYHTQALQLADLAPVVAQEQIWVLQQVEYLLKQQLPASFFEWFVRLSLPDLLANQLNGAHLTNLVEEAQNINEPILTFLVENQGVCQWGIALDDGKDPLVLVKVENTYWQTCAIQFSEFVYWTLYDYRFLESTCFVAHTSPLAANDLHLLEATFAKQTQTYGWPGRVNYRFSSEKGSILIWAGKRQTDWWIAPVTGQMKAILELVWDYHEISQFLYAIKDEAEASLQQFRLEHATTN